MFGNNQPNESKQDTNVCISFIFQIHAAAQYIRKSNKFNLAYPTIKQVPHEQNNALPTHPGSDGSSGADSSVKHTQWPVQLIPERET